MGRSLSSRMNRLTEIGDQIGLRAAVHYSLAQKSRAASRILPHRIRVRRGPSVRYRPGSSDLDVFRQVFVEDEYGPVSERFGTRGPATIVDCGANVGYSTAYFLNRYPRARAVAVEPEAGNYRLLLDNTASYFDRVSCVQAGVWNRSGWLRVSSVSDCDDREWSYQVEEVPDKEPGAFPAFTVPELLDLVGAESISLLKMDIEGAEAVVFDSPDLSWLSRIDTIAIELHDQTHFGVASGRFFKAIEGRFDVVRSGELHIATSRRAEGRS
jgi:FkbM family methyltransferase